MSFSRNIPPRPPMAHHMRLVGGEAESDEPTDAPAADALVGDADEAHLTHELANLLDGAMRYGAMAQRLIDATTAHPDASRQLQIVNDAMGRMADLLRRWRAGGDRSVLRQYDERGTIGDAVDHAVGLLTPLAIELNVAIDVDIEAAAAGLPVGPMYPVLSNALRNAIESIGQRGGQGRVTVTVTCEASPGGRVRLTISDTGPGVHADLPRDASGVVLHGATTKGELRGHGLELSRRIVTALGGVLWLRDRCEGSGGEAGAEFGAEWPVP